MQSIITPSGFPVGVFFVIWIKGRTLNPKLLTKETGPG